MTPREAIEPYLEHMHPDDASSTEAVFAKASAEVDFEVTRVVDYHEYPAYGYGRRVRMTFEPDDFRGGRPSLDLIVEFQPPRFRPAGERVEFPSYELAWSHSRVPAASQFYPATKISEAVNRVLNGGLVEATGCDLFGGPENAKARYGLYDPDGGRSRSILRCNPYGKNPSKLLVYYPGSLWPSACDFSGMFVVHRDDVRKYAPKFFEENCLSTGSG